MDQVADLLKALLTPLIAAIATYIAYQQWKTNQLRLRLDRYERRLAIYKEVRKILSLVIRDGFATSEALLEFRAAVSEADFLFGNEIRTYIDEIYARGLKLWHWHEQYRDHTQQQPEGYDHQKVVDGMDDELSWFTEQFDPAKGAFAKYLDVGR